MTKKFMSMFLALAMCLALSVPAFAAGEEPELTDEPAVQTEVETEAQEEVAAPAGEPAVEDELAAQADDIHVHDFKVTPANYVVRGDHTASEHLYVERNLNKCACGIYFYTTIDEYYQPHTFRVSEYGVALGDNGETVTTYLYECRACNYYSIRT